MRVSELQSRLDEVGRVEPPPTLYCSEPEPCCLGQTLDANGGWREGLTIGHSVMQNDQPLVTIKGKAALMLDAPAGQTLNLHQNFSVSGFGVSHPFSEIEVRALGKGYAVAHGRFGLKRTAAGGGDASGRFTLVLRKTKSGWKIIHDHSS